MVCVCVCEFSFLYTVLFRCDLLCCLASSFSLSPCHYVFITHFHCIEFPIFNKIGRFHDDMLFFLFLLFPHQQVDPINFPFNLMTKYRQNQSKQFAFVLHIFFFNRKTLFLHNSILFNMTGVKRKK